ncbi:MAG: ABC transporter permease [Propionibacteriaceae bacterium]|jgi:ABC-2 type transport system permease protein|nr:ABC transporter permease [Propionibacteriaceae bacterium]
MRNLKTVLEFEVSRTLKKPLFWIMSLLGPIGIGVVFAISALSSVSGAEAEQNQANAEISFEYLDHSGLVDRDIARSMGGNAIADPAAGVQHVQQGGVDAFFEYPAKPTEEPIKSAGTDVGVFDSMKYESIAKMVLQLSVQKALGDPEKIQISLGYLSVESVTYRGSEASAGIWEVIPPAVFLVVFFLIIVLLGNKMLMVGMEEKENRVTEMILTTINPTALLAGKVISTFIVGMVQIAVIVVPSVIAAIVFPSALGLGGFQFSDLVWVPERIVIGAVMLLAGFALFAGASAAVGAMMPTAQDASGAFSVVMITAMMPLWALMAIVSTPDSLVSQFMTYFPMSAPITVILRNALGIIEWWQALLSIGIVAISTAVAFAVAVRIFRYGSISYSKAVSLKTVLSRQ